MNQLMKHLDEMTTVDKFSESDKDIQCKIREELVPVKTSSKKNSQLITTAIRRLHLCE